MDNISNHILNNVFIKQLFPFGLEYNFMIGQIQIDLTGTIRINLHTRQKPEVEIKKWGKWGENYNIVVLKLRGTLIESLKINDIEDIDFCETQFTQQENITEIKQSIKNWSIHLKVEHLTFEECTTYTN